MSDRHPMTGNEMSGAAAGGAYAPVLCHAQGKEQQHFGCTDEPLLVVSGGPLLFLYVPSVERAYGSIKDLEYAVTFGSWIRSVHRFAAHFMVAAVFFIVVEIALVAFPIYVTFVASTLTAEQKALLTRLVVLYAERLRHQPQERCAVALEAGPKGRTRQRSPGLDAREGDDRYKAVAFFLPK
mgnify:CR=1 FL=1